MKANEFQVLERAVEEGVTYGWSRAHKHVDDPGEFALKEAIVAAVLNSISEWFRFEDRYVEKDDAPF